jgi:hypothetical protein
MKIIKTSSVILLSLFFMWMFVPHLSAKHHYNKYYKYKNRSSAFALNFNVVNPAPRYVEYNYVAPAPCPTPYPAPCYERVVVAPTYRPYVEERVYYPAPAPVPVYREQVIVERPYTSGIYIQPQFSFSYWR